jgi:hypothetical protein
MSVVFTYNLWPEGEERRALAVHEQQVAGAELAAAGVVVDAEREPAGVVVDAEAVGALEAHAGPLPHRVHRRRPAFPFCSSSPTTTMGTAGSVRRRRVYPCTHMVGAEDDGCRGKGRGREGVVVVVREYIGLT